MSPSASIAARCTSDEPHAPLRRAHLQRVLVLPEREALQAAIDKTSANVNGTVRVKLYKGNVIVVGRKAANSLYNANLSTFEDDGGAYDQKDAAGFIRSRRSGCARSAASAVPGHVRDEVVVFELMRRGVVPSLVDAKVTRPK